MKFKLLILFHLLFVTPLWCDEEPFEEDEEEWVINCFGNSEDSSEDVTFEQNLATLGSEPSSIVNGCVNVLNGTFIESGCNLASPGPRPLMVQHLYTSSSGWWINEPEKVRIPSKKHPKIVTHSYRGMYTSFSDLDGEKYDYRVRHTNYRRGLTNSASGYVGGKNNSHNMAMVIRPHEMREDKLRATVCDGTGIVKKFETPLIRKSKEAGSKVYSGSALTYEQPSRGPRTSYTYLYGPRGWAIEEVINQNNQQELNSLNYSYEPYKTEGCLIAYANRGKSGFCRYTFDKKDKEKLLSIFSSSAPYVEYFYQKDTNLLTKIARAHGRELEIEYYTVEHIDKKAKNKEEVTKSLGRVHSLKAPVGPHHFDKNLYITHRFVYKTVEDKNNNILSGSTHVFDIHDQETIYHFDADSRLRGIHECGDAQTNRIHLFFWFDQNSPHDGNLRLQTLQTSLHQLVSCRMYIYDNQQNVTQDILFGSLTGHHTTPPQISPEGAVIENGCERYQTNFVYSQDVFNNLLKEQDEQKDVYYLYYPQTDLLKAKFVVEPQSQQIRYREFYDYDDNRCIIRFAYDDGSSQEEGDLTGVTERHLLYTKYREVFPFGIPQIFEEKYLDLNTGEEKLLKKIIQDHNAQGLVVRHDEYDANGCHLYRLEKNYDLHGNLLSETDPLGYQSTYTYDVLDNRITEQHPGDVHFTHYTYDNCNRLTDIVDVHPAGILLKKKQAFDGLGQKMWSLDWFGNPTNYEYDRLGRPVRTIYPEILHTDGYLYRPFDSASYDIAGNKISKTDPLGRTVNTSYNLRGQPLTICYADGTQEANFYSLSGLLKKNIAINGTVTDFEHDYLGRITKTIISGSGGQSVTQTVYNHFHKLQEIDAKGVITSYQYDPAGRLKVISKEASKTVYEYDSCSRIAKILEYFGPGEKDYLVKAQEYDHLNHVIEERQEDAQGTVLTRVRYAYSPRGDRSHVISYHQETPAITTYEYNDYGEIEKITDPQGHVTLTHFHYLYVNAWGQNVYAKEVIDALGNTLFLENDTLGRLKWEIRKDNFGCIVQKREYNYDAAGNCIEQIEHLLAPDSPEDKIRHCFSYDVNNNLTRWVLSAGKPEEKQVLYNYNAARQKTALIKPDGTRLEYTYDFLGRLSDFKSSKGDFHYQYTYDANFNVVAVQDLVKGTQTQRIYDSNNRLTQETLANGLQMAYRYDAAGRTIQIILPDQSSVDYIYHSHHLGEIRRGKYTYTYQKYNAGGLLEEATMIGLAGSIQYKQDANRRLIEMQTPVWREQIPEGGFDPVGNLIKKIVTDIEKLVCQYTYDALNQLTSEEGVQKHTFKHDSLYQLYEKDEIPHSVNSLSQLLHDGESSYKYDINGNLIEKGDYTFSYDSLDRLVEVHKNGKLLATYAYDELNRRMHSIVEGKTTHYLYQGQNEIGAADAAGTLYQLRVLGLGKGAEIGAAVLFEIQGKTYAPVHDSIGNVCGLIHPEKGTLVENYRYSAYGEEVTPQNPISPWRFSSKRTDSETQFVYFGNRYYSPTIARWITSDPLGLKAGPNLYAYVCNNPLRHFDLYGLEVAGGFWSTLADMGSFACKTLGQAIYSFGRELIPFPLLKDPFQFVGHVLQGNDPSTYTMSYRETHSQMILVAKGSQPGSKVVMVNGICTEKDDATARGLEEYNNRGGLHDVYVCYNATHGLMADLFECAGQLIGVKTNSTDVFIDGMTDAYSALGAGGTIYLNAHSQGGLICYDGARTLDASILSRTDAYTVGSPMALTENTYGRITNVAADWDYVTWGTRFANGVKNCVSMGSNNITVVKTIGRVLDAHYYNGPTYLKAMDERLSYINSK